MDFSVCINIYKIAIDFSIYFKGSDAEKPDFHELSTFQPIDLSVLGYIELGRYSPLWMHAMGKIDIQNWTPIVHDSKCNYKVIIHCLVGIS